MCVDGVSDFGPTLCVAAVNSAKSHSVERASRADECRDIDIMALKRCRFRFDRTRRE